MSVVPLKAPPPLRRTVTAPASAFITSVLPRLWAVSSFYTTARRRVRVGSGRPRRKKKKAPATGPRGVFADPTTTWKTAPVRVRLCSGDRPRVFTGRRPCGFPSTARGTTSRRFVRGKRPRRSSGLVRRRVFRSDRRADRKIRRARA